MDNKTSSFDKVQYKEGYFVLIPNLISFIALFVVIIVFYSIFPQIAPQVIVTSFVIYSIIFHALYTARFYSVNSNYAKELFVKFTYEKLTLKTVFLKKLNAQLSEFIIILFFLYLYIAFGQTYLVTTISDIEINDEFNAFVELTSSAAFYAFLIPVIAVINILFYRFTLAIRFDYQYYFSLGCFKIIQKYYDIIDEAIPFLYKMAFMHMTLF